ncbi:MAG: hypothetical protein HN899_02355 [Gemmatimonadales bacterium]|nr:hypothetical protein [Gemmatimonadales bacterium]MBT6888525.1 hypothetical protein [Gemmatimonadales bacterium]MBT7123983.1 hypothetical protein [Gemmatimonadales bacterium]
MLPHPLVRDQLDLIQLRQIRFPIGDPQLASLVGPVRTKAARNPAVVLRVRRILEYFTKHLAPEPAESASNRVDTLNEMVRWV